MKINDPVSVLREVQNRLCFITKTIQELPLDNPVVTICPHDEKIQDTLQFLYETYELSTIGLKLTDPDYKDHVLSPEEKDFVNKMYLPASSIISFQDEQDEMGEDNE